MLKVLTKKLRNQTLNEIQPFQLKISYPPSDEDSDDSEGENQELVQIDRGVFVYAVDDTGSNLKQAFPGNDILSCAQLQK
ncbi:hypothetical protein ASZ78_008849 [Callipepla squamata]|uniref:Uncharacterized protein n=1 Tax=Callipepla squamata TaxID=9009 RepID=A0A226NE19_CALSU|nr:hypothetical protein ASZ78_008849 [Callipepla squamata]